MMRRYCPSSEAASTSRPAMHQTPKYALFQAAGVAAGTRGGGGTRVRTVLVPNHPIGLTSLGFTNDSVK